MISCDNQMTIMETQRPERNLHHFNFRTAFMSGFYEGEFTMQSLAQKGDFGLGTFNNLDGEMIVLDGKVYRATADGKAIEVVDPNIKTPSAMVTFFQADRQVYFESTAKGELIEWIKENLDTEKDMYALKITGTFNTLKARSQNPVFSKPFPEIEAIVDNMVYHDLEYVSGTLVGFQLPPYLENVNYPGLHFHFIGDEPLGGCAPDFSIRKASLSIMRMNSFSVDIPQNEDYYNLDMNEEKNKVM